MIYDSSFSKIYKNLSYSMQKLTDEIFDVMNKKSFLKKLRILSLIILALCCFFIFVFRKQCIYQLYATDITRGLMRLLTMIDLFQIEQVHINNFAQNFIWLLMIFLILLSLCIYILSININKYDVKFKSYKERLKHLISSDFQFCNCSINCNCQDEYIRFMESKGIDLIS